MGEQDKTNSSRKEIVSREETSNLPAEDVLQVTDTVRLNLAGLPDEQKQALKAKYVESMIEVARKAAEVGVDTKALDQKLGTMVRHTTEVAQSGSSVTITSTGDDSIGRTEIIMGTSDAARKGKLSKTQTGQRDLTLVWIGLAAFVIIVIAIIALMK